MGVVCGPSREIRQGIWSSALALAMFLLLSPWLELIIIPSTVLAGLSLVAYRCSSMKLNVIHERRKEKRGDFIHVYLTIQNLESFPVEVEVIDLLNVKEYTFRKTLKSKEKSTFEYVLDSRTSEVLFSPGYLLIIRAKGCECVTFEEDVLFNINLRGKGFVKVLETEGNQVSVPEIQGVREYRPGDDLRLIVWKSLGKVGGLRVKELAKVSESMKAELEEISKFEVKCNEWCENACVKRIIDAIVTELENMGLKRGKGGLVVTPPGSHVEDSQLVLLINPSTCIIEPQFAKRTIRELKKELVREVEEYAKELKSRGLEVLIIP